MKPAACILLAALALLSAPAFAQDEDLAEPATAPAPAKKKPRASALIDAVENDAAEPAPAPSRKAKPSPKAATPKPRASAKPAAKPGAKTSAKAPKAPKDAKPTKRAQPDPIPDGALEALDTAVAAVLKEKHAQPVVAQEPAAEGEELSVSIETLDQSLDAQLKKVNRQPATPLETKLTTGLHTLLDTLKERGAAAGPTTPHTASLAPRDQGPPLPDVPTQAPSPDASTPAEASPTPDAVAAAPADGPATAPPPLGAPSTPPATPDAETPPDQPPAPTTPPVELAPLATPARRYVLSRIAVSRDGAAEQDLPVPQGGTVRPVPLAHRGGNPPVEMKMLLRVPAEIGLGESTQVVAQASAQAAGVAAELTVADEVVDQVRAAEGGDTTGGAGVVSYSFLKKVGGVYAYQQTFAQGDGRTPSATPSRTILLNWTDRDATLEIPFAWVSTSPSTLALRGRLIYAPANRP